MRTTKQEHLENLDTVLSWLESAGMRLKYDKCAFLLPLVEYLGHKISAQDLQQSDFKVEAIKMLLHQQMFHCSIPFWA